MPTGQPPSGLTPAQAAAAAGGFCSWGGRLGGERSNRGDCGRLGARREGCGGVSAIAVRGPLAAVAFRHGAGLGRIWQGGDGAKSRRGRHEAVGLLQVGPQSREVRSQLDPVRKGRAAWAVSPCDFLAANEDAEAGGEDQLDASGVDQDHEDGTPEQPERAELLVWGFPLGGFLGWCFRAHVLFVVFVVGQIRELPCALPSV